MKGNWTYHDLLDLEHCLSQDRDQDQAYLHERDRYIYLECSDDERVEDQDSLVFHWLLSRKNQLFAEGKSPGRLVAETFRTISLIILICGIVAGLVSGFSFFSYSGTTPVNVLNFLFIFVFSQLLMIVFLLLAAGLRLAGFNLLPAPIATLYGIISGWFLSRSKKLGSHFSAEQRNTYYQLDGLLRKQKSTYSPVFYWPLFSLSQLTMTGFNLGLLGATFFKILTSDIAFGWQSTIQFSTTFIFNMTRILALPWSWFIPGQYAYPSTAAIEGSRIVLKDGIYHLSTQDLVSWWPFLILSILFYGLLVRLLLLGIGKIGQFRAIRSLQLNTPDLIHLIQRMTAPLVSSQADDAADSRIESDWLDHGPEQVSEQSQGASYTLLLLIPADVSENYDPAVFNKLLRTRGFSVSEYKIVLENFDSDHTLLQELHTNKLQENSGVLVIMESWMPPIKETLLFIQEIRSAVGDKVPIFVGLLGQGSDNHTISKPSTIEKKIWQQKIDGTADPYLSLLDIRTDTNDDT